MATKWRLFWNMLANIEEYLGKRLDMLRGTNIFSRKYEKILVIIFGQVSSH